MYADVRTSEILAIPMSRVTYIKFGIRWKYGPREDESHGYREKIAR
jgi:hypothetical protein